VEMLRRGGLAKVVVWKCTKARYETFVGDSFLGIRPSFSLEGETVRAI
jgi:hypothetical protein